VVAAGLDGREQPGGARSDGGSAAGPTARARPADRSTTLDGIRGIAILLVIVYHHGLFSFGWVGVQLFFVLSGYLITKNLLRDRNSPARTFFYQFYRRRVRRIFPIYYAYLALLACLALVSSKASAFWDYWHYLVTYTYNFSTLSSHWEFSRWFGHFWSLCVEEQFYLVWPFVVFWLTSARLKRAIVIMMVLAPVCRALTAVLLEGHLRGYLIGNTVYGLPFSHMDAFAFGAVVVLLQNSTRIGRPLVLLLGLVALTAVLGMVNLRSLLHEGSLSRMRALTSLGYPLAHTGNALHVWGYTVLNATSAAAILCAARNKLVWLGRPWLAYIGRTSYCAYVVHWAVIMLVSRVLGRELGQLTTSQRLLHLAVALPIILLIAGASHRWFESRFVPRLRPASTTTA
jgi:peptidoglycan/LPS O-acetylase OafA/YrhL